MSEATAGFEEEYVRLRMMYPAIKGRISPKEGGTNPLIIQYLVVYQVR